MAAPVTLIPAGRYAELKATGKLPSPKGVALAIIRLLRKDDYPLSELQDLVQSDPAMAGRLLKSANTAIFGHARPIVSLRKAIVALGALHVRDLVTGFSILDANRTGKCLAFDYHGFWARSLATAIACQALSKFAHITSDDHFTVGLFSRIGELGLASLFPEEYGALLKTGAASAKLAAMERTDFGFDHRQLGATMITDWGLPRVLVEATYHHEDPSAADLPPGSRLNTLTLSLDFARVLSEVCMAREDTRWSLIPNLITRSAHLGIGADALSALVDSVVADWKDWGSMLQVRTRDQPPFAELLAENPPRPKATVRHGARLGWRTVLLCSPGIEADEIATMLTSLGRVPRVVSTGKEHASILADPPELVVADIDMPGAEFPGLCRALRQNPAGSDIFFLVIASPDHEWAALRAIDAGADDVILKPVTLQNLRLRLSMAERLKLLRERVRSERRGLVRSADEFAGEHRQLIEVALTDPLTELPNRRHGLDYLAAETGSSRGNRPLACLMVDIDHFKLINDEHGHAAGDAVLRQLAVRLKGASRLEDMVFRYGGEEFALLLPAADAALALGIAERIRGLVEDEAFDFEARRLKITVSIGLAVLGEKIRGAEALIKAADAALYEAKRKGRNRVELAP